MPQDGDSMQDCIPIGMVFSACYHDHLTPKKARLENATSAVPKNTVLQRHNRLLYWARRSMKAARTLRHTAYCWVHRGGLLWPRMNSHAARSSPRGSNISTGTSSIASELHAIAIKNMLYRNPRIHGSVASRATSRLNHSILTIAQAAMV